MTGRADFARVARDTLDYLLREMTAPDGGFYSATDADSKRPDGKSEEGAFFVWSEAEIRQLLGAGPETERFIRYYGVTAGGNFEGANILAVAAPDEREHAALAPAARGAVRGAAHRPPPFRDEKILAAWNGLAISALRRVGGARVRRAALRRRRRARGDASCSTRCAPTAGWRAAPRTAASGPPASSTTTRSRARG